MKFTAIFLLAAALQLSATGNAQRITLSEKNAPLEKVFKEIRKQSGYSFVYTQQMLEGTKNVNLQLKNVSLQNALEECLKEQPLTYSIINNTVVIKPQVPSVTIIEETPTQLPPPIDVSGKVVDSTGAPLVGASIRVRGTKQGTTTDNNGFFTLKGVDENAVLEISYQGFELYSVKASANIGTVGLKMKDVVGEEVLINTGYQKLKPNEMTGSIVQINNEQFNRSASPDLLSRLQGITSGLLFQTGTEDFGNNQRDNLLIRSTSTIFGVRSPLIVLDNFPFEGDISTLNPADIENVTFLKDAAAASIWGAKAGNGVVVITTKNGRYNQKTKISFSSIMSFKQKSDLSYAPTLSSGDFIDIETYLFNQDFYNSSITSISRPPLTPAVEILLKRKNGQISSADSASQLNVLRTYDIRKDIEKNYYDSPLMQQYNLNLAGGGNNQRYYLSIGYNHNKTKANDDQRLTINASHIYSLMNNRLEIETGIWGAQTKGRDYNTQYGFTYPYARLADDNGNPLTIAKYREGYIDTAGAGKLLDWSYYPLKERDFTNSKKTGLNYRLMAGVKFKIIRPLSIDIKYQYSKSQTDFNTLYSLESFYARDLINQFSNINWTTGAVTRPVPLGGILDNRHATSVYQNARMQLNYSAYLSKNQEHHLTGIAGGEFSDASSSGNSYRYYGYNPEIGTSVPVDLVNTYKNYVTGNNSRIPSNQGFTGTNTRYVSVYANVSYTFKNRYIIYGSSRKDGSNIFGATTNNKWKPLWSAGVRWDIDKEAFYRIDWLPFVKMRASYGYQGNVNNSLAALLTTINSGSVSNRWRQPYSLIQNYPNANLRWENIGQFNIGIDFAFKKDIVSGTVEYYRKRGVDLIGDQILPPSSGLGTIKANSANIKGEGVDLTLNTIARLGKIQWVTTLLFSYAQDRVTKYKSTVGNIQNYVSGGINPIVGRPVSALYSYRWASLDPVTGDPQGYIDHQVSKNYSQLLTSTNLNDMVYQGPQIAPYFGSLLNTVKWKNLALSINITYKFGHYFRRSSINYSNLIFGSDKGHKDYNLRWQKPGDENITNVPSFIYPTDYNRDVFYSLSEVLVEKGDHIRLQDARISYDLSRNKSNRLPFNNLRVYLYATNLGILWRANKLNIDPDYVPLNDYTSGLPGKTISVGINMDF